MSMSLALVTLLTVQSIADVKTGRLLGLASINPTEGIYEIDSDAGFATQLFEINPDPSEGDVAVAPDGTVYGAFSGNSDQLGIIDMEKEEAILVGPFGIDDVSALAFDSYGILYGYDQVTCSVIRINPDTGNGQVLFDSGLSLFGFGMGLDPTTGIMYLVGAPLGGSASLYRIDFDNQEVIEVGQVDPSSLSPHERLRELTAILANGIQRLRAIIPATPECRQIPAESWPSGLDPGA